MNDLCTPQGAERLKAWIEAYWRDRGYDVTCTIHDEPFVTAMRSGRADVRSDMRNGMPVRKAARRAA